MTTTARRSVLLAAVALLLAVPSAHAGDERGPEAKFTSGGQVVHKMAFGIELVKAAPLLTADAPQKPDFLLPAARPNDDGTHLDVHVAGHTTDGRPTGFLLLRHPGKSATPPQMQVSYWRVRGLSTKAKLVPSGGWEIATRTPAKKWEAFETFGDVVGPRAPQTYASIVYSEQEDAGFDNITGLSAPLLSQNVTTPVAAWFNTTRWFFLFVIIAMALALYAYIAIVRKNPGGVFIRRIAGVDAIEEAVGRSTEMGRPVLYVTGVEEIQNIQTIASLLVLGRVAEMTAEYDTEMKVANFFPLTMVVAEEIVKQGFANAGRIDAHKPENVMFISAEQFAFAAGVNGLILRDKPACNIYLGRFFAESLILAETGYVTKAIQIAGTAEITQLPFFIAACDYTIIGEELYAVSAYLSREPNLLAQLKASDLMKVGILAIVVVGAALSLFDIFNLGAFLLP